MFEFHSDRKGKNENKTTVYYYVFHIRKQFFFVIFKCVGVHLIRNLTFEELKKHKMFQSFIYIYICTHNNILINMHVKSMAIWQKR